MTVGTLVSVEEYLNSNYDPDCDYIDGELIERNMGEQNHGRLQARITQWLMARENPSRYRTLVEVRLRVRRDRFRIPDLMLIPVAAANEQIVTTPPLLCIEILSPCDTFRSMWERISEYLAMGVPVCWIIDPVNERAVCATPGIWADVTDGILRAGEIEMPLSEVLERQ